MQLAYLQQRKHFVSVYSIYVLKSKMLTHCVSEAMTFNLPKIINLKSNKCLNNICKSNKIIKCTKLKCKAYLVQGKETENIDLPI